MYAYLSSDWELSNRGKWLYGYVVPLVDGCSTTLDLAVAAVERERNKDVAESAARGGWRARAAFEFYRWPTIYRVPLNAMITPGKAKPVYGTRWRRGLDGAFWGPLDTPVSDQEIADRAARETFRRDNRDADDPMRALVEASSKRLPKLAKNPRPLYVTYDYKLIRRTIGIFDSYDKAVTAAPGHAPIIEVLDGSRTKLRDGTLRRGQFSTGWGYSSGFAPDARAARARS